MIFTLVKSNLRQAVLAGGQNLLNRAIFLILGCYYTFYTFKIIPINVFNTDQLPFTKYQNTRLLKQKQTKTLAVYVFYWHTDSVASLATL